MFPTQQPKSERLETSYSASHGFVDAATWEAEEEERLLARALALSLEKSPFQTSTPTKVWSLAFLTKLQQSQAFQIAQNSMPATTTAFHDAVLSPPLH